MSIVPGSDVKGGTIGRDALTEPRNDWTRAEAQAVYDLPFADLIFQAQSIHRRNFDPNHVETASLLSIKTGGCPEDCGYCSQSAKYDTGLKATKLMEHDDVVETAKRAKEAGAERFCMAAAWRNPKDKDLDKVCEMVSAVKDLGMETCVTLGMLTDSQAKRLHDAGLDFYNHNVDTSPEFYGNIITTRTMQDRIDTLAHAREAGLKVCCGGIIGMGEGDADVVDLAFALRELGVDSLPLNFLLAIDGTPLADARQVSATRALRALCLMRFTNPASDIRAAGGRERNLGSWQGLALYPANSVFVEGYLTTAGLATAPTRDLVAAMGFTVEGEVEMVGDAPVELHA
jgi:biotin synthase